MRSARSGYRDRTDAGRVLAEHVAASAALPADGPRAVVLALPRGGVPVAAAVAERLGVPLDVLTVRKVGTPGHEELAIGAVASGGLVVLNEDLVARLALDDAAVAARVAVARRELAERDARLRGDRPPLGLTGRPVVLVDDGLATGATMRAAVAAVRAAAPARVVVAVPVGAPDSVEELAALADEVICPLQPPSFAAVGQWYRDFRETTDAEVAALLARHDG
jgi:putative phosphoribosyl transferase